MRSIRPSRTLGLLNRCVFEGLGSPLPAQPVLQVQFLGPQDFLSKQERRKLGFIPDHYMLSNVLG
jgi:hypothetical protein